MFSGLWSGIIGRLLRDGSGLFRSRHLVIIGDSMLPTLAHRQHVQTLPLPEGGHRSGTVRGYIVAFRHPQKPQIIYVKRIVGLPDEHVALEDGRVSINGSPQPEPYLAPSLTAGLIPPLPGRPPRREYARQWFTGSREYFLLGDNRADSEDSRSFGPVAGRLIIGRVWFRYWPPRVWRSGRPAPEKPGREIAG